MNWRKSRGSRFGLPEFATSHPCPAMKRRCLLSALAVCLLSASTATAEEAAPDAKRFVISEGVPAVLPRAQGARVGSHEGALQFQITGGHAWARVFFVNVPTDIRLYETLHLRVRGAEGAGAFHLRVRDRDQRVASLRVEAPGAKWSERAIALGDFRADRGFDPTQISSLSLVWYKPVAQQVSLGHLVLEPGPQGWRHSPRRRAQGVFGERGMRSVRQVDAGAFDLWTDVARARSKLPQQLATAFENASRLLAVPADDLASFRCPVYVIKSTRTYRDYCQRVLGWTGEEASRSTGHVANGAVVMLRSGTSHDKLTRYVGVSLFKHAYGSGGGAWLHEGVAKYLEEVANERSPGQQSKARIASGGPWPLASLLGAAQLPRHLPEGRLGLHPRDPAGRVARGVPAQRPPGVGKRGCRGWRHCGGHRPRTVGIDA